MGFEALIPALVSLFGLLKGGGSQATTTSATTDPKIDAMLATQQARTNLQNPLFEAVTRMAMGLLPKQYQQPLGATSWGGGQGGGATPAEPLGGGRPSTDPSGRVPWMRPEQPWSSPNEIRRRQDNMRPAR